MPVEGSEAFLKKLTFVNHLSFSQSTNEAFG